MGEYIHGLTQYKLLEQSGQNNIQGYTQYKPLE